MEVRALLLHIDKLTDIRITKVRENLIRFYVKDKKYIMFENYYEDLEEDFASPQLGLYEVTENGLIKISYSFLGIELNEFLRDLSKRNPTHLVYSNLDIEWFVKRLVVNKFASYKPFNDELKDLGYLRLQINKEIKELEDLLNKANNDFIKTPKRGMKVLKGLEIQEKIKKFGKYYIL